MSIRVWMGTRCGLPLLALATACAPPGTSAPTAADQAAGGEGGAPAAVASPSFDDYPTGKVPGIATPAAVDLISHPDGRQFRTMLTRGALDGPNYGGSFTVITWGCGTMCQRSMIVDARSGRIVADLLSSLGLEFRLDSRLLVVNPPAAVEENPCPTCATRHYVIDEGGTLVPTGATAAGAGGER